jgi:hypothetical protein
MEVLNNTLTQLDYKLIEEINKNLILIKDIENIVYLYRIFSFKKL